MFRQILLLPRLLLLLLIVLVSEILVLRPPQAVMAGIGPGYGSSVFSHFFADEASFPVPVPCLERCFA